METILILVGLVTLALPGATPQMREYKTLQVDAKFVKQQKKMLSLVQQQDANAEYYKIGQGYDVKAHIDNYTDKKAVEKFLTMYKVGFMPKNLEFSIFYQKMREEAIALFELLYFAKDFESFFQTAAFAKVHLNQRQFLYAYYIAVLHRPDTSSFILPAPYDIDPQLFVNMDVYSKMASIQQQNGIYDNKLDEQIEVVFENGIYIIKSNNSGSLEILDNEYRLAYFREDYELNSVYYYRHMRLPFWWNSTKYGTLNERRGEEYSNFYQQLLAHYGLQRRTSGLSAISNFSWHEPFKTGFNPGLSSYNTTFARRSNNFNINNANNFGEVLFLDTYENKFSLYLKTGLKANKNINFVGNYWQTNADLGVTPLDQRSYEITALRLLGAAPVQSNEYKITPSALDLYETSLRDPAFYQFYNKIVNYINDFKKSLDLYTKENLHFIGAEITGMSVDELSTFFDYHDLDITNSLNNEETKTSSNVYIVRQPRLNHKAFSVTIDVNSDVTTDAVVKLFMGPKYNDDDTIPLEENWMNLVELDSSAIKLTPGQNRIVRSSDNFSFYREDAAPIGDINRLLEEGSIPAVMANISVAFPQRLLLPRGTKTGFPLQMVAFTHSASPASTEPLGYPFDRPANFEYDSLPNMFVKDVNVFHEGD